MTGKKVTIRDIANYLDVSVTTVSFALNDKGDISDETRSRIKEVASDMGYRPDHLARSLVTGVSHTVGVIIPDVSNQFFAETVRYLQTELASQGYDMILCNSEELMQNDLKYIDLLSGRQVDGLIMTLSAQSMEKENQARVQNALNRAGVPYVFLDRCYREDMPVVAIDNLDSGYTVAKYLIDHGHTNIGLITGPMCLNSSFNRLDGFMKAMKERGIPVPEENVVHLSYNMESGRQGAQQLLARGVTAIFAFNDLQAYGVLSYINECGLSVPEDVSLVGFDDVFYSSILKTKLTTVRQPIRELATETCKMTIKLMKGEACPQAVKLKTELIVRDSVADIQ